MIIERIVICNPEHLTSLLVSSFSEGNVFMKQFLEEFDSQYSTEKDEAEAYFLAKINDKVIGMIGLTKDHHSKEGNIGKLQHLYVLPQFRKRGVASALIMQAIQFARAYFETLTLNLDTPQIEKFYNKFGFIKNNHFNYSTHVLHL